MDRTGIELWKLGAGALLALLACTDSVEPGERSPTLLVGVHPAAGAVDVSLDAHLEVRFDQRIPQTMRSFVALHEGPCPGPVVGGIWLLTEDGAGLTLDPAPPMAAGTEYTIHLGGGLTAGGQVLLDLEAHGVELGGQWATESMVRGMDGMGMGMGGIHIGPGWSDSHNTYGLVFSFTTAD